MAALARATGTTTVPATIQALLAARLDRLAAEEREVLECGAIEGEVFHRSAVRALSGERTATEVDSRLTGLVRKELIRPHPATIRDDDAFRFRHLLIRDAAYDALPKARRADLHETFARWLEQRPSATSLSSMRSPGGTSSRRCATGGSSVRARTRRCRVTPPTICTPPAGARASASRCASREAFA